MNIKLKMFDEAISLPCLKISTFGFLTMTFQKTTLWREGESLVCEITEHIYSKFWWNKRPLLGLFLKLWSALWCA